MQVKYLIICALLNFRLFGMERKIEVSTNTRPQQSMPQSSTSSRQPNEDTSFSSSLLSRSAPSPIGPSKQQIEILTDNRDLSALAKGLMYETAPVENMLSSLRQVTKDNIANHTVIENELNTYIKQRCIYRLGYIAEEAARHKDIVNQTLAKVAFDILVKLYNQSRYDISGLEFRWFCKSTQFHLIKLILSQSKYLSPELIHYDKFNIEEAFEALRIYDATIKKQYIQTDKNILFNNTTSIMISVAQYNKDHKLSNPEACCPCISCPERCCQCVIL